MREPAETKALQRLKTHPKESHNRTRTPLENKLVALVKALARSAAEEDVRAEREQNGTIKP